MPTLLHTNRARRCSRSPLSRGLTLVLASPGGVILLGLLGGRSSWIADLALNMLAPLLVLLGMGTCVQLFRRRWLVACACGGLMVWGGIVVVGWRSEIGMGYGTAVRMLIVNARAENPDVEGVERALNADEHDIAVVVEVPTPLAVRLRDEGLGPWFPHRAIGVPNAGVSQWVIILSRWPITAWETPALAERSGVAACVIEHPEGRFGMVAIHASSPRTRGKWVAGNATIELASRVAAEMRQSGLEVVVAGDLNATPTGSRSRRLAHAGLAITKPWHRIDGTYPAGAPLRLAIDNAMASKGWRTVGWRSVEFPGSDHRGLRVELGRAHGAR